MFAETYAEVQFIWNANMDIDLVKSVKPDIVISELAERFMPKTIPTDSFSLVTYEDQILSQQSAHSN